MLGPYQLDESPSRPLTITVSDQVGLLDLDDYSEITIESTPPLPAGFVSTEVVATVQYDFTAPFTEAGQYRFRIRLETTEGRVDFTPYLEFNVTDDILVFVDNVTESIITPDEAYRISGSAVSTDDIMRAESVISLLLDRDLTDVVWFEGLSGADQRRLRTAVAYWAASPEPVIPAYPSNVRSLSTGEQSISFSDSGNNNGIAVPAMAAIALRQLSWLRNRGTEFVAPFLGERTSRVWTTESAFYHDVVRGMPLDKDLWSAI